jgi:hypothetical protein
MLRTVWTIRDEHGVVLVEDVEALCRGVLRKRAGANYERRADRTPAAVRLEPIDWRDSLAFLLGEVVILERQYDPTRAGIVFRAWLFQQLQWRLIDEWRRRFGRHGQHRVADTGAALNAGRDAGRDAGIEDDDADENLRGHPFREPAGGDPADRSDVERWLDPDGDREEAGPVGGLRRLAGPGVEGRADRPGAGAWSRAGRAAAGASGVPAFLDCTGCGWRTYPQAPNGVDAWHWPDRCLGCEQAIAPPADREPAA